MAAKKYYGVKKGKVTGLFTSWEDCKASVDGFPGAEYRGFASREEACAYLGIFPEEEEKKSAEEVCGDGAMSGTSAGRGNTSVASHLVVYVDGSYDDTLKKYAFGCVFLLPDGRIFTQFGNGDHPQSLQHRNVTGEMLGAMYAVKSAMMGGYGKIEICYDYEGVEKWVTGAWKSKTELTGKYAASMREWSQGIQIVFRKVPAHSNVKYNELADRLAKQGLTEGNGVPKVKIPEELISYRE